MHPPEKRRRLKEKVNTNNLSPSSLDPLVYHYESDKVESEQEKISQNYSIDEQFTEDFISQPTSKEISKEVESLKRKMLLSNYWEKISRSFIFLTG